MLIGEIEHRNRTPDGRYRHPSWRGLRPDRTPSDIPPPTAPQTVRSAAPLAPEQVRVDGAMQTPDGTWRVEALRRGDTHWYRIVHGDNIVDGLTITGVQELLHEASIDLADLTDADPAA